MRTRLRLEQSPSSPLGPAPGHGARLPAFAWDATVEVKTTCLDDGGVKVTYTVSLGEAAAPGDVSPPTT